MEFKSLFEPLKEKITNENFQEEWIQAIVEAFHLPCPKMKLEEKAALILEQLFLSISSFQLSHFIHSYLKKKNERKRFLIAVLYGLYYADLDLTRFQKLDSIRNLEHLLLQYVAENSSIATIKGIVKSLSLDQKLRLTCFLFRDYREGSYILLNELEKDKNLKKLIIWIRRNYFDVSKLQLLLIERTSIEDTTQILSDLEAHALEQTTLFFHFFHELIPLMIDFPVRVYQEYGTMTRFISGVHIPDPLKRKQAEEKKASLAQGFAPFFKNRYTLNDFQQFVRIFGLYGDLPFLKVFGAPLLEINSLPGKIGLMVEMFKHPVTDIGRLKDVELTEFYNFAYSIIHHLESIIYYPERYKEGFDFLVCAMPTKGRLLENNPSLSSQIKANASFCNWLSKKLGVKVSLKDYPFFVLDQSDEKLFLKNCKYIDKLNRRFKSAIIPISETEALELAKKIGIEKLLDTTRTGNLGFRGARNGIFLLAPILKKAFEMGKKSPKEVLQMDSKVLQSLLKEYVFETKSSSGYFMIDDDLELPEANLFAFTITSLLFQEQYFYIYGYSYGRATKFALRFRNLNELLDDPLRNFSFTEWYRTNPLGATMSEYIGRPKICLNLPFGGEEADLEINPKHTYLLQGSYHLAGPRHPKKEIPTHFFVGLDEVLKNHIPYVLQIEMFWGFADSDNKRKRCVFPWNDEGIREHFSNFQQFLEYMGKEGTKQEMQRRFWRNVWDFYENGSSWLLGEDLDYLTHMDINAYPFSSQFQLLPNEKRSLKRIRDLFKFYQKDALFFEHFLQQLYKRKEEVTQVVIEIKEQMEKEQEMQFSDYPLTWGFYLLCRVVGLGEFCNLIGNMITKV